jgi:hypothetical protein
MDKSLTIGEALKTCKYFSQVIWTSRDEAGRQYVDASCKLDGMEIQKAMEASPELIDADSRRQMAHQQRSEVVTLLSAMNVTFRFVVNRDRTVSFREATFASDGAPQKVDKPEDVLRSVYNDTFPRSLSRLLGMTR